MSWWKNFISRVEFSYAVYDNNTSNVLYHYIRQNRSNVNESIRVLVCDEEKLTLKVWILKSSLILRIVEHKLIKHYRYIFKIMQYILKYKK